MNRHPPQPFVGQRVFAALAFSYCLVHRETPFANADADPEANRRRKTAYALIHS
jgi:hypothetical protein